MLLEQHAQLWKQPKDLIVGKVSVFVEHASVRAWQKQKNTEMIEM